MQVGGEASDSNKREGVTPGWRENEELSYRGSRERGSQEEPSLVKEEDLGCVTLR